MFPCFMILRPKRSTQSECLWDFRDSERLESKASSALSMRSSMLSLMTLIPVATMKRLNTRAMVESSHLASYPAFMARKTAVNPRIMPTATYVSDIRWRPLATSAGDILRFPRRMAAMPTM